MATLTATVHCQLPGEGADTWRPFNFKATFKVLDEFAQQELDDRELSRGDFLREVLVSVDGVPSTTDPETGSEVSAKECAIRNPFTSGALWGEYIARFAKNANDAVQRSLEGKNSRRSRKH